MICDAHNIVPINFEDPVCKGRYCLTLLKILVSKEMLYPLRSLLNEGILYPFEDSTYPFEDSAYEIDKVLKEYCVLLKIPLNEGIYLF